MSDHTHSPWIVDGAYSEGLRVLSTDDRATIVAELGPYSNDQAQANARLIAAAPDLLEAAQSANKSATDLEDDMVAISGASYRLLRQAISKATNPQHKAKEKE